MRQTSAKVAKTFFYISVMQVVITYSNEKTDTMSDTLNIHTLDGIIVTGRRGDILQNVTGEESRILNPSQMSVTRAINLIPSLSQ